MRRALLGVPIVFNNIKQSYFFPWLERFLGITITTSLKNSLHVCLLIVDLCLTDPRIVGKCIYMWGKIIILRM